MPIIKYSIFLSDMHIAIPRVVSLEPLGLISLPIIN